MNARSAAEASEYGTRSALADEVLPVFAALDPLVPARAR